MYSLFSLLFFLSFIFFSFFFVLAAVSLYFVFKLMAHIKLTLGFIGIDGEGAGHDGDYAVEGLRSATMNFGSSERDDRHLSVLEHVGA